MSKLPLKSPKWRGREFPLNPNFGVDFDFREGSALMINT